VVGCLDVFSKFTVELAIIPDTLVHLTTASVFTTKGTAWESWYQLKTYTPIRQLFTSFRRTSLSISSLRPAAHKMSITPTCLLPVERNDEELRNGSVHIAQKLRDYVKHFLTRSKRVGTLFWVTLHLSTAQMTGGGEQTNKMKKNSRAKEVQANSAVCLTSSSGNNELRSFFPHTWTDVRNRTHVEFWIPANGYNTATAQNWPRPDMFPSFNCLHSTPSSFSSLFIPVFYSFQHSLSLSYFFLRSFTLLTLHFFHFFLPHPPNRCPPNDPHPPTHQLCLFFPCLIFKPHVFSRCSLQSVKYYFKVEKIWTHLQNTYFMRKRTTAVSANILLLNESNSCTIQKLPIWS